jgi:hypothetical protein
VPDNIAINVITFIENAENPMCLSMVAASHSFIGVSGAFILIAKNQLSKFGQEHILEADHVEGAE